MIQDDEKYKEIYGLSGYYLDRAEESGAILSVRGSKTLDGLHTGKSLWCGESLILKTVLKEFGIEAKTMYCGPSYFDESEPRYAWTQVKLDGEWYNTDLDEDKILIKNGHVPGKFLLTDKELPDRYYVAIGEREECSHKLSHEEKISIIGPILKEKEKEKSLRKIQEEKEALERKTREEKERILKERNK